MRLHAYNEFLSTRINTLTVIELLGKENYNLLLQHFGEKDVAVFEADEDTNKAAFNKAMGSWFVGMSNDTYDVIVYTKDGTDSFRKGNYFSVDGKNYLAYAGKPDMSQYQLSKHEYLLKVLEKQGV